MSIRTHGLGFTFALLIAVLVTVNGNAGSAATGDRQGSIAAQRYAPVSVASVDKRAFARGRIVRIRYVAGSGNILHSATIRLAFHPDWLQVGSLWGQPDISIDARRVESFLLHSRPSSVVAPVHCAILSSEIEDRGVLRAVTRQRGLEHETTDQPCVAKDGYTFDASAAARRIALALLEKTPDVTLELESVKGYVTDGRTETNTIYHKLATGRSDFAGSGEGRKANVRKAIGERLNNVLIEPGATFSFVSVLGQRIEVDTGWQMAFAIFDGETLRLVPGGGICQASTTLYRALLSAGLPIPKHKNHSLYVSYYEKHGVGLDATVYPGQQDLKFINDTGHPLLIQAHTEGTEAFVSLYGVADGRTVTLDGPYFSRTATPEVTGKRKIYANQILWRRTVAYPDGTNPLDEWLLSQYKILPKGISSKWPPQQTINAIGTANADVLARKM